MMAWSQNKVATHAGAKWRSAPTIVERLERDGRFQTLLTALDLAGLKSTLAGDGPFTLLAPTDEAFAALPDGALDRLVADKAALTQVLLYHVIGGNRYSKSLIETSTSPTLEGNPVLVLREDLRVLINGNRVINPDWRASNGVIHVIGGVLLPPASPVSINSLVDVLKLDGRFTTLLFALEATGLDAELKQAGPFTLLAPTDDAFDALPEGALAALVADKDALAKVLLYHVLSGGRSIANLLLAKEATTLQGETVAVKLNTHGIFVNDSRVRNYNVHAPNGIIHTLDAVLLPPAAPANIIAALEADGRFKTLLFALSATGLDEALKEEGPFTLFAPTDTAFAALPRGTLDALIADAEALKKVLLYHVIPAEKNAQTLLGERKATTLEGSPVYIYRWFNRVFVNRSLVLGADVDGGNGLVHVISRVLIPPQ
jgi:transforming growth factor-beta-induced protein